MIMEKLFICGYEKIESDYGYWPSFHDDIVEKIEISSESITMFIKMQKYPKGKDRYPKIRLMFCKVKDFYLEGEIYGCASIILDMVCQKKEESIETQITSSLGAGGTITCNKICVEKED
jgi:hypothetical protein